MQRLTIRLGSVAMFALEKSLESSEETKESPSGEGVETVPQTRHEMNDSGKQQVVETNSRRGAIKLVRAHGRANACPALIEAIMRMGEWRIFVWTGLKVQDEAQCQVTWTVFQVSRFAHLVLWLGWGKSGGVSGYVPRGVRTPCGTYLQVTCGRDIWKGRCWFDSIKHSPLESPAFCSLFSLLQQPRPLDVGPLGARSIKHPGRTQQLRPPSCRQRRDRKCQPAKRPLLCPPRHGAIA